MQKKYACVRYVHTRITVYHPCKIDLRHSKALHSCVTCRLLQLDLPCSAIHYGMCHAVSVPPSPSSSSPSPQSTLPQTSKPVAVCARPVSAQISKPLPAKTTRPAAACPKPVPVSKPAQSQPVPIQVVSFKSAVSSTAVNSTSGRSAALGPKPVQTGSGSQAGLVEDSAKNGRQTTSVPRPVQPQPVTALAVARPQQNTGQSTPVQKSLPLQPQPATTPAVSKPQPNGGQPGLVQKSPPVQRKPAVGQVARAVSHSVQPVVPVVVRTGSVDSAGSVTLPGGGVVVRSSGGGGGSGEGGGSGLAAAAADSRIENQNGRGSVLPSTNRPEGGRGFPRDDVTPGTTSPSDADSPARSVVSIRASYEDKAGPPLFSPTRSADGASQPSNPAIVTATAENTFDAPGKFPNSAPLKRTIDNAVDKPAKFPNSQTLTDDTVRTPNQSPNSATLKTASEDPAADAQAKLRTNATATKTPPEAGDRLDPVQREKQDSAGRPSASAGDGVYSSAGSRVDTVVVQTPKTVTRAKPLWSTLPPSTPGMDEEDRVYPAFPVSPEDRVQTPPSPPAAAPQPSSPETDDHPHPSGRREDPHTQPPSFPHHPATTTSPSPSSDNYVIITAASTTGTTSTTSIPATVASATTSPLSSSDTEGNNEQGGDSSRPSGNPPNGHVSLSAPILSRETIPQFYFPKGKPPEGSDDAESVIQKAEAEFSKLEGGKAYKEQMGQVAKACGFPLYWKILLFRAAGGETQGFVTLQSFSAMLQQVCVGGQDEASMFVHLVARPGRHEMESDDLVPLVQDVVDGHPGLSFLQDAPEFHSRYIHTVISRIFFCVNRSWSGRITTRELRRSNFLRVLASLEDEEDINQVTDYFSYEHFYVIYCKFWELDKDHDLYIDKADLARHNDHALSSRIIDRIFSGAVSRGKDFQEGRMPYKEFVWFLIAEEDKRHPTSIEYWFRCMDQDGDGVISMYEMEYFYEEQVQKMEAMGIEKLPFEDCLCQMFDLVRPRTDQRITLGDLKNCLMADIFFDTFFNLDKFLEHEQRDPFCSTREVDAAGNEVSDWDRYAAEEYDILVAEEGLHEQEEILFDEDVECDDSDNKAEVRLLEPLRSDVTPRPHPATGEDVYDYADNVLGF